VKSGCGSTNASQTETITTGSRLPQKVQRNRQITDAASPVTVFDQKDIQTSGASSVEELLRRRGVTR
jgi:outer membrane cobalamin receptor